MYARRRQREKKVGKSEWKNVGKLFSFQQSLYVLIRDVFDAMKIGEEIIPWLLSDEGKNVLVNDFLRPLGERFLGDKEKKMKMHKPLSLTSSRVESKYSSGVKAEWRDVYGEIGINEDFSDLGEIAEQEGFYPVLVSSKVRLEKLKKISGLFPCEFLADIDEAQNSRIPCERSYCVYVRSSQEKALTVRQAMGGEYSINWVERLLFEAWYFFKFGQHPSEEFFATHCGASRFHRDNEYSGCVTIGLIRGVFSLRWAGENLPHEALWFTKVYFPNTIF